MKIIAVLIAVYGILTVPTAKATTKNDSVIVDRIEDGYITFEIIQDNKLSYTTVPKEKYPTIKEGDVLYENK